MKKLKTLFENFTVFKTDINAIQANIVENTDSAWFGILIGKYGEYYVKYDNDVEAKHEIFLRWQQFKNIFVKVINAQKGTLEQQITGNTSQAFVDGDQGPVQIKRILDNYFKTGSSNEMRPAVLGIISSFIEQVNVIQQLYDLFAPVFANLQTTATPVSGLMADQIVAELVKEPNENLKKEIISELDKTHVKKTELDDKADKSTNNQQHQQLLIKIQTNESNISALKTRNDGQDTKITTLEGYSAWENVPAQYISAEGKNGVWSKQFPASQWLPAILVDNTNSNTRINTLIFCLIDSTNKISEKEFVKFSTTELPIVSHSGAHSATKSTHLLTKYAGEQLFQNKIPTNIAEFLNDQIRLKKKLVIGDPTDKIIFENRSYITSGGSSFEVLEIDVDSQNGFDNVFRVLTNNNSSDNFTVQNGSARFNDYRAPIADYYLVQKKYVDDEIKKATKKWLFTINRANNNSNIVSKDGQNYSLFKNYDGASRDDNLFVIAQNSGNVPSSANKFFTNGKLYKVYLRIKINAVNRNPWNVGQIKPIVCDIKSRSASDFANDFINQTNFNILTSIQYQSFGNNSAPNYSRSNGHNLTVGNDRIYGEKLWHEWQFNIGTNGTAWGLARIKDEYISAKSVDNTIKEVHLKAFGRSDPLVSNKKAFGIKFDRPSDWESHWQTVQFEIEEIV